MFRRVFARVIAAFGAAFIWWAGVAFAHTDGVTHGEIAAARPGQVLRVWPLIGAATPGAKAYRILYRSTGFRGEAIAVTGSIIFPEGPPPPEGRNVIAWAHPTTGVADKCAPSIRPINRFSIMGVDEMIARGFVVAATDYPGLGTPGMHPYLIGVSEGRAVLDSVRAARDLPSTAATDKFAVWGHSQGGQASLFTGQIARSYAPELTLVGVAAAAPATYLAELFEIDNAAGDGAGLTAMTLISWSKVFGLSLKGLVVPSMLPAVERVASDCIETIPDFLQEMRDAAPLAKGFLLRDPTKVPSWRAIMNRNTPGNAPAGAPVFLAQGTTDTTVDPPVTRKFREHLCNNGETVLYQEWPRVSHTYIARDSADAAITWMSDRFAGLPAPNNCGS